jgi:hypothetical protein
MHPIDLAQIMLAMLLILLLATVLGVAMILVRSF